MVAADLDGDIIGVDLGGTKIYGARFTRDGDTIRVDDQVKESTPTTDAGAVIDALVAVVESLTDRPVVVGVGAPGVVDSESGRVLVAPNLPGFDRSVPLRSLLADRLGCEVAVGNDVNLAALAETRIGAARGHDDVLAVWMGTGLGGGLVLDGRLRTGPNGMAAELGHVVVVPGGRRCRCGGTGHLEAYIGRRAIEERARALAAEGRGSELVDSAGAGPMKSKVFRQAYDSGDEVAVELLEEGLAMLGLAVANVAVTVDLDAVVVGGGLGERMGGEAVEWITKALENHGMVTAPPTVVTAALGDDAGAIGAAFLGLETSSRARSGS